MGKPKKIDECSQAFRILAIQLALSEIQIFACRHCGGPVKGGYCCGRCGSESPTARDQEPVMVES